VAESDRAARIRSSEDKRLATTWAAARASTGDPATVAAKVAEVESMRGFFFNFPLQGAVMGATVFLIGAVESLIGAAVVRRRG